MLPTLLLLLTAPAPADPAPYSLLTDVVVAPDGDVFVADAGLARIVCISERWGPPRVVAVFEDPVRRPGRLALGPDASLFVSFPGEHVVARVDIESGAIAIVAGTGKPGLDRDGRATERPLASPCGLAWDGAGLWIADLGNRALRRVDLEQGTIRTVAGGWDATRTETVDGVFDAPGRFLPCAVGLATDGSLLVLDLVTAGVLRLDGESGALVPLPGFGAAAGDDARIVDRLAGRRDLAIDPDGRVLLADAPAGRIVRATPGAPLEPLAQGLGWPAAVDVGTQGEVLVVDAHRAQVLELSADGRLVPRYRAELPPPDRFEPSLETLRAEPDPDVVTDAAVRDAIRATGHAWHVRHVPTGLELVLVPPGSYVRGARTTAHDVRGDARPTYEVRLSKPIYVSRTEVTNAALRRHDPNHVSLLSLHHDLSEALDGVVLDGDLQPATNLSWYDAQDFAQRWGFRLPTEAEWEYVARAGATTTFPWGDAYEDGRGWANVAGPEVARVLRSEVEPAPFDDEHLVTAPVASYRANAFGLYDVIGNVWEWCADWYAADAYAELARAGGAAVDPTGPATGTARVLRGGSWQMPFKGSAQLSYRGGTRPGAHFVLSRGMRVVLDPP
jgi:formylglycine-generating enzyme required for sulfatase activity